MYQIQSLVTSQLGNLWDENITNSMFERIGARLALAGGQCAYEVRTVVMSDAMLPFLPCLAPQPLMAMS